MSQCNADQPIQPPPPSHELLAQTPVTPPPLRAAPSQTSPFKTPERASSCSASLSSSSHYSRILSPTQSRGTTTTSISIQLFENQSQHPLENPPPQTEHDVKDQLNEKKEFKHVAGQNPRLLTASQSRLCIKRYIPYLIILN